MASGTLGTADLAAGTYTTLYTTPASTYTVVSLNIINRGNVPTGIRVATAATGTPTNAEFIEYETELFPRGVLERTGIVLEAGRNLVVWSSEANVSAVAFGIETSIV